MLNPETNSDSASLKSKGDRWVSANVQINHNGKNNKKTTDDITLEDSILKDIIKTITKIKTVLKTDS